MAVGLLVAVLAACIYTAQDEKLQELYKLLLHPFELLLGAVIGLITGEPTVTALQLAVAANVWEFRYGRR